MRGFRSRLSAVLVIAALCSFVGTASSASAATKPKSGGTLRLAFSREATGFDIVQSAGATQNANGDSHQFQAVFDVLVYEDLKTGDVKNQIAQSFTSTDGIVWVLKLRPNVKFTDGTAYDAAAVKFNWERIANPANRSNQASAVGTIASIDVVDAQTLRLTLKARNGQFPRLVARGFPFVGSPTAIQAKGTGFSTSPVGAGPFVIKEWVRNSSLTLTRNPTYWNSPRPYLDALIINQVPDQDQRYNTFVSKGADMMGVGLEYGLQARANSDGYASVKDTQGFGGSFQAFNMKKAPFNDVIARRAVVNAIDTKAMVKTLYSGVVAAPTSLFPKTSPFYDPKYKLEGYDPAAAQKGFDEYAAKTGKPLEFTINLQPTQTAEGNFFLTQLAAYKNVTAKVDYIIAADFLGRFNTGNFNMQGAGISGYDPEPDIYNHLFTGQSRNFMGYSNPEMDAALAKGRSALDDKDRVAAYKVVQRLVRQDVPEFLYRPGFASFLLQKTVKGAVLTGCCLLYENLWLRSA